MKPAILIPALLVLMLVGSASALEYRMPVNIQTTTTPAVLMPGDEALLEIDLQNGAASYGTGGENTYGRVLSTPISKTTLKGTDELFVITEDYSDLGMIGPSDKITLYYKIKAADNISGGTYLLDFEVLGGYDMITICREIPIKVDVAPVSLSRADSPISSTTPGTALTSSMSLNVANPREGSLNAVTIMPSAEGVRFSPEEYYIGTMDSDEVFTISFDMEQDIKPGGRATGQADIFASPINMSFVSKFKNGDNWHESKPYNTSYIAPMGDLNNSNNMYLIGGAALIIVAAAGFYVYRRRKAQNGKNQNNKSGLA